MGAPVHDTVFTHGTHGNGRSSSSVGHNETGCEGIMNGEKTLSMPRRFGVSHLALSLASGLMGDLSPNMQTSVLPVGDTGQQLSACGSVAARRIDYK